MAQLEKCRVKEGDKLVCKTEDEEVVEIDINEVLAEKKEDSDEM